MVLYIDRGVLIFYWTLLICALGNQIYSLVKWRCSNMHEETAQIIMHLEDILSLSLWTNRRDKYRNIGNKFDSKFIPAVGGLSFLTLSATIGTTIFSSINETVGTIGGIGSGLA